MNNENTIKICLIGDGAVGKTFTILQYTNRYDPTKGENYIPTIFENYDQKITMGGKEYNLLIADTAGQEEYDRNRYMQYHGVHCYIILHDFSAPDSFENIFSDGKWLGVGVGVQMILARLFPPF